MSLVKGCRHSYPDRVSPGISTWPFSFAAPTSRFLALAELLLLKSVVKVPSTSWMVESISVVISGSASVTAASTVTGSPGFSARASFTAWAVASLSRVSPFSDGVMTNSPSSLVMVAFFGAPSKSAHCAAR